MHLPHEFPRIFSASCPQGAAWHPARPPTGQKARPTDISNHQNLQATAIT
jgi:hypothetical protein